MLFSEILGIKEPVKEAIKREAVRGIVIKDDQLLMIKSNKGDVKLPGGGIDENESQEEALRREMKEETGYDVLSMSPLIGVITERKRDKFIPDTFFEMISYYYIIEVSKVSSDIKLTDSEKVLDMRPVWLSIEDAIDQNEKLLKESVDCNSWVVRELKVLHYLHQELDALRSSNYF
jgi:8-oxo-dGTP pyrophosphatase MutT (NUDIX family)